MPTKNFSEKEPPPNTCRDRGAELPPSKVSKPDCVFELVGDPLRVYQIGYDGNKVHVLGVSEKERLVRESAYQKAVEERDALQLKYNKYCSEYEKLYAERDALRAELAEADRRWKSCLEYIDKHELEDIEKLTVERDRLRIALEKISLYVAYNGDTWPADIATQALKPKGES